MLSQGSKVPEVKKAGKSLQFPVYSLRREEFTVSGLQFTQGRVYSFQFPVYS
jgi:hypothetical protein